MILGLLLWWSCLLLWVVGLPGAVGCQLGLVSVNILFFVLVIRFGCLVGLVIDLEVFLNKSENVYIINL